MFTQPQFSTPVLAPPTAMLEGEIVPRWEWRVFERTFASAPAVEPTGEPLVEHTYILSLLSPHCVKVRDGRLEVKRLERLHPGGIQLWRPALKAQFPIDGQALAAAAAAWGIPTPALRAPSYSLSDLLREVVVGHRELRLVTLTKQRMRFSVGACHGERGQITIGRHRWNTLSFEDADPALVLRTLNELGQEPARNEDYPRALKRILALPDHSSEPRPMVLH